ncbi:hypothetical protein QUF80_08110 [Desulfococcaceae bacterium HSG8]|nr:hypothetical protein [Desulfococcaceae bacterium HSG8]
MIKIEQELAYFPKILKKISKGYRMPYLYGTVLNPHNGEKTYTAKKFLADTGAAITVLNRSFNLLFKDKNTPIIEEIPIQYGGSLTKLPVYNVKLKIKGIEFDIPAAFDKRLGTHSLLGNFGFLNNFDHFGISKKRNKLRLIKVKG